MLLLHRDGSQINSFFMFISYFWTFFWISGYILFTEYFPWKTKFRKSNTCIPLQSGVIWIKEVKLLLETIIVSFFNYNFLSHRFEPMHCEISVVWSDERFHFTSKRNKFWTDPRMNCLTSAKKILLRSTSFQQCGTFFCTTPFSSLYLGYIDWVAL